jgi:hypothetical protein
VSSPEAKNLEAISRAIDEHNVTCEWPAVAVEMNPFEVERLGSSAPARTGCRRRRRRSRPWRTRRFPQS